MKAPSRPGFDGARAPHRKAVSMLSWCGSRWALASMTLFPIEEKACTSNMSRESHVTPQANGLLARDSLHLWQLRNGQYITSSLSSTESSWRHRLVRCCCGRHLRFRLPMKQRGPGSLHEQYVPIRAEAEGWSSYQWLCKWWVLFTVRVPCSTLRAGLRCTSTDIHRLSQSSRNWVVMCPYEVDDMYRRSPRRRILQFKKAQSATNSFGRMLKHIVNNSSNSYQLLYPSPANPLRA